MAKTTPQNRVIWARKNDYGPWNRESYVVSCILGLITWFFFDIPFASKIVITALFILLAIVARILRDNVSDIDLLNFAITGFAWIWPAVPLVMKLLTSVVLAGILVLVRRNVQLKESLTGARYLLVFAASLLIGPLEFWIFRSLMSSFVPDTVLGTNLQVVTSGIMYGLIIGLPLGLIGSARKNLNRWFGAGFLVHLVLILLAILLGIFSMALTAIGVDLSSLNIGGRDFYSLALQGVVGPSLFVFIAIAGFFQNVFGILSAIPMLGGFTLAVWSDYLFTYQFAWLGNKMSTILDTP